MSKYSNNVNRLKKLQVFLAAACLLALAVYGFVITRPTITSYVVKDECGPIGGTISHSIDDHDTCANACNAYCGSLDKEYYSSKFEENNIECHSCDCKCKE